ncbi:MAG: hypothetical protein Q7J29_09435 [Stagnimonas sp.]|nr:hypothetical protein [Stagnimonas sp.]
MSGPESMKPDDQLLDEFLAEQGAVRETYRALAKEQAPAHLDAAVLRVAHEAAARPVAHVRRRRWQTPLAAAAVVVLSFGVFLQVQRDPAVQQEVIAVPEQSASATAPAVLEPSHDTAKAKLLDEAASTRNEADTNTKRAPAVVAKPKPAAHAEKRRAESADAPPTPAPPPPPMAMADAPAPPIAKTAPEAEAIEAESLARSAAADAVVRESMQRQERFAAAAAPMSKASRAPQTSSRMVQSAPAPAASETGAAVAIEHWAQDCADVPVTLTVLTLWRGLTVTSWAQQAGNQRLRTTLRFAPEVTREAIAVSLGSLAAKASLATLQCDAPMTRELRPSDDGWTLVCECPTAATE